MRHSQRRHCHRIFCMAQRGSKRILRPSNTFTYDKHISLAGRQAGRHACIKFNRTNPPENAQLCWQRATVWGWARQMPHTSSSLITTTNPMSVHPYYAVFLAVAVHNTQTRVRHTVYHIIHAYTISIYDIYAQISK